MKTSLAEGDLPSDCYMGIAEIMGGSLVGILALLWPPLWTVSGAMVLDGIRRVADGTVQLGEERRNNPNYTPPAAYKF